MTYTTEAGMAARLASLTLILLLAACGGSSSDATDSGLPVADSGAPDAPSADAAAPDAVIPDAGIPADAFIATGDHHQFVINTLDIPSSSAEANACGLNIDGDSQGRVDNALGQVISALAGSTGADPQPVMDAALADGTALHLLDVQADSLADDPTVALRPFLGDDSDANPSNNFSGSEMFTISASSPTDDLVPGAIGSGALDLGPGTMSVRIVVVSGTQPIQVPIIGVHVTGNITDTNITSGILAGAVTQDTIDNILIPSVTLSLQAVVASDCGGTYPNCCTDASNGQTIVSLFDDNNDCMVSQSEVANNNLVNSLLAPDVDLLDASGNYAPNSDGVNDSLSLGVCFTAVGAVFTLP